MVRNYVRKTERASYSGEDMFRAINAWKTGQMSLRQAARTYKVPKSTLCSKLKQFKGDTAPDPDVGAAKVERTYEVKDVPDVPLESSYDLNLWSPQNMCRDDSACKQGELIIRQVSQADKVQKIVYSKLIKFNEGDITNMTPRLGRKTIFGVDEEAKLERLIVEKQASGFGLTKQDVCRLAFYFAESNGIQHPFRQDREMAGRFWLDGFLMRHPQIELRTGKGLSKEIVRSLFESCLDDGTPSAVLQLGGNQMKTEKEGILQVEHFNQPLETACHGGELVINRLRIFHSPSGEHHEDIEGWIDDDGDPDLSCDEMNISNAEVHVVKDHQGTQSDGEQEQTADNQASNETDLVELYIKEEAPAYMYSEPGWNAALSPSQQTTCNETNFTAAVGTPVLDGTNPCKRKTNQHLKCGEQTAGDKETVTTGHDPSNSTDEISQHQQRSDCHIQQKDSTSSDIRTHERKRSHCCVHCSKDFSTKSHLDCHIKTHIANRPFQCTFCHKRYLTKSDLTSHTRKVHTEEKRYECSHCHKSLFDERYLKRHLLVHTEEKLNECSQCHMCFLTKQHPERHILLHTGEKPFQCQYCSKSFVEKDNLAKHTTVHTGEKLFHCPHCMKSFITNSTLKRHMIKHPPVKHYKCSYCPKFFATKCYYTRHNLLIHTRERPNACSHCPKFFATKSCLLNHMRTHTEEKSSV